MSIRHSKNSVGALSTLKLIFLISIDTCVVLINAIALPLLNLIDTLPTIDISIITIRSSYASARYYSLLTINTLAAPISSRIP
jgi:hypothetical protein